MTVIQQNDLIQSIADSLQYISYYHPLFVSGLPDGRVKSGKRCNGANPD